MSVAALTKWQVTHTLPESSPAGFTAGHCLGKFSATRPETLQSGGVWLSEHCRTACLLSRRGNPAPDHVPCVVISRMLKGLSIPGD